MLSRLYRSQIYNAYKELCAVLSPVLQSTRSALGFSYPPSG